MIKVERFVYFKNIFLVVFIAICSLVLSSCISDDYDDGDTTRGNVDEQLMLTFVVPNINVSTRAEEGYEDGSVYENLVDINNHDYRIYFFSYKGEGDNSAGTLIAQFKPTRTVSSTSENETRYIVSGAVPDKLLDVNSFRVVVLANWGDYPEDYDLTEGETTIDDLTEGTYSTFSAEKKFEINADNLIPFYGVQEFTDVDIIEGGITELSDEVSLLRALAKVEIVLYDDEFTFSEVTLHNYNSTGYSAPEGVYLSSDYIHSGDDKWKNDYVQTLHLVNDGKNDDNATENIAYFKKTKDRGIDSNGDTQYETWVLYIPEYSNQNDEDAAYIEVKFDYELTDDVSYQIFFQDYDDVSGKPKEDGTVWDIHRNNLYRFNVSVGQNGLEINVDEWGEVFDNKLTYGTMSEITPTGTTIYFEDNTIMYEVISDNEDEGLTVKLTHVDNREYYSIPSTIYYLGYTYTVVSIGSGCFQADNSVLFISIPKTVTDIESLAFYGDTSLQAIALHSETPPTCADDAFSGGDHVESITLYVPESSVDTYKGFDVWGDFENIVGIDYSQYE